MIIDHRASYFDGSYQLRRSERLEGRQRGGGYARLRGEWPTPRPQALDRRSRYLRPALSARHCVHWAAASMAMMYTPADRPAPPRTASDNAVRLTPAGYLNASLLGGVGRGCVAAGAFPRWLIECTVAPPPR